MISADRFRTSSVQTVIFTPNTTEFSQGKLLGQVLARYAYRYDGPIEAVNLPADAPPNAPCMSLKSKDSSWQLQAAPARIDSFWRPPLTNLLNPSQEELPDQEMIAECARMLVDIVETGLRVGRLALVINRFCLAENPPRELIDHFAHPDVQQGPFRNSAAFEVHNLKKYPLKPELTINSWVRCRSGVLSQGHQPVVTVEQDLNTLEEDSLKRWFTADMARDFFERSATEASSILQTYFP